MAENQVVPVTPMTKDTLSRLLENPTVRELGTSIVKKAIKDAAGITEEKKTVNKPFGRVMYALKDFIQGTWWVILLFYLGLGLTAIVLALLRKVLQI